MPTLPLSDIVKIIVNLSPRSAVRKGFNLGLIVGTSDVITASDRVKLYSTADAMIEDGFADDMPEYEAARLYFMQQRRPDRVAIGRHVQSTGLMEIRVTNEEGTTPGEFTIRLMPAVAASDHQFMYQTSPSIITPPAYGDILPSGWMPITDGEDVAGDDGDYIMVVEVSQADSSVTMAGMAILGGGSVDLGIPVAESVIDAIRACRAKNTDWYVVTYCGASTDDIFDIAQYVEGAKPECVQFYTTDETSALTGDPASIFNRLKLLNYMRSLGQYSVTPDAVAGIMGYAMGANVKTARSAFTLMHKRVTGILPDDLDETQAYHLQNAYGNYYVSRGYDGEYSMFEQGTMANGTWFDEVLNLDMLVNDLQLAILDVLASRPKVPQDEGGMNDLKLAMFPCLRKSRSIGFIAPGRWNGPDIWLTEDHLALHTGDMLDDGYLILSEPVDGQSQADRDERIAPPIYAPIKLAGAIHTVLVQIDVNR